MPSAFVNPFADAIEPRFRTQPAPDVRPQTPQRTSRRKRFTEAIVSGLRITCDADRERAAEEAAREAENIRSRASPKTLLKNQRIKECWEDYIHVFRSENQPRLSASEIWQPELVETKMYGFLSTMVKYTAPRKGFETLHATTLLSWYHTFIRLIVENMQVDGQPHGFNFLRDKDRIAKLKDKVQQLIFDNKLRRITNTRLGFSRHEIKILLTAILDSSNHSATERIFAFQTIFAITIAFCGALRPSSLAVANTLAIKQDQYLHIGDFQLFVHGPLDWEIRIHVTNFKCSFGATASEQFHRYRSLKKGHNLLFDPTVWAVLNWYTRGVFLKKYKDFAEFCNDNSGEIEFDPAKKTEPAFLAGLAGQNGKFSNKPMTATNLVGIFGSWCEKALLPRCGFGAMRRYKADLWGMQLGFELTQVLMNHARGGVYHNAYTRKNENYDLPALAMGEVAGSLEKAPGEVIKRMEDQQLFIGVAVECLVRTAQNTDKSKTKAERAEVVEDHPDIIAHNQLVNDAFAELLECLTPITSLPPKITTRSVNALMSKVLDEPEDSDCPRIIPGKEVRCHVIHARLLDLFRRGYRIKANINRLIKHDESQQLTHAIKYGSRTGTVEHRYEAVKQSQALDSHVLEAGAESLTGSSVQFPGNLDSVGAWCEAIQQRMLEEEQELQEAEDYIEEEREHMASLQNLVNLTGASINLNKLPQNDDTDDVEPPLEQAEVGEEDVLNLPIAELRWALMNHLLKPVLEMEELQENTVKSNGKVMLQCPDCKFRGPSLSHLNRHKARIHTPWAELMSSFKGARVCACPEGDYSVQKLCRLVKHMLTKCKEKDKYISMYQSAEMEKDHYHKGEVGYKKPERNYVVKERKKRGRKPTELMPEEDDPAENSESDDDGERNPKVAENKGKKPAKRMRMEEDSAKDSEDSDLESWHEDSTLDVVVEPFTAVLRDRNPAPAPVDNEEGLLVESITRKTLKQKLSTKKPLPTLINLLRSVCDELEDSGLDLTALDDNTPDLDAFELLSLEDCMS